MTDLRTFTHAAGTGLIIAAAAVSTALAQQTIAPASATPTPGPMPPVLANYATVTSARLTKPEDGNWLLFRRTYNGWGYSPLAAITPENVSRLQPVWSFATGQVEGHQAPPMVNNGVMFVATPGNQLLTIDAKTGGVLWRYKRPIPEDMTQLHPTNRGVGLYGDKVFFAATEAVLVALDAKTGKEVWTTKVEDYKKGYYMSLAPLVVDGRVMVGVSGGELGVRGFVAAFDAETGKELWRTFMIPEPGQPGSETWPQGDQWKTGGGSVWVTGTYDPDTDLAFWGTGNGGPWMGDQRPGDNLFTSSVVALDAKTGQIKGYFQYHPNDSWDWDEVSPPILVDYQRDGKTVKGLVNVARDGYLWQLERTPDKINFIAGQPFVRQNVFKGLDVKTGRPDVDPAHKPGTDKAADFCPGIWGGKDWPPVAYSPQTRLLYIPANENMCAQVTGETPKKYVPGERYMGVGKLVVTAVEGADHFGELQAWDLDTGKRAWTTNLPSQNWGPLLATGGGLVFAGGTNDRMFRAFDAKSGKILWEFPTSSGVNGVPVSYAVDGKQYIAVQSGWGVDAARMQSRLNLLFPGRYPEVPQGGQIWVFAVK
jgi:alcohol dehydrogenase (cytochrome c)